MDRHPIEYTNVHKMVKVSKSMKGGCLNMKTILFVLFTIVVVVGGAFLFHYFVNSHTQKTTSTSGTTAKQIMDHFENYAPEIQVA